MSQTGEWITTASGRSFSLHDPQPSDVCIEDIAHALSNLCRWTGHTRNFYSVAQHSMLVAEKLPAEAKLHGLMHDAHEAYIGDISRPLKRYLGSELIKQLESRIDEAIFIRFGIDPYYELVHDADSRMLATEARILCRDSKWAERMPHYEDVQILPWPAGNSRSVFVAAFRQYGGQE